MASPLWSSSSAVTPSSGRISHISPPCWKERRTAVKLSPQKKALWLELCMKSASTSPLGA